MPWYVGLIMLVIAIVASIIAWGGKGGKKK